MNREIHAHEVMEWLSGRAEGTSRAGLAEAIREAFGPGTLFEACSGGGMTAEELVEFLMIRGKLEGPETNLRLAGAGACDHGA